MNIQADQPPKKKRRQNVACDPCKLRRIKCDLLNLLSALDDPSTTSEDQPAHLLVRRHPGVICTQCRNKALQCTTEGILNPLKANKGGKRIDEARQRFGGDTAVSTPAPPSGQRDGNGSGMNWSSGPEFGGLLDQISRNQAASDGLDRPTPSSSNTSWIAMQDNRDSTSLQQSASIDTTFLHTQDLATGPSKTSNDTQASLPTLSQFSTSATFHRLDAADHSSTFASDDPSNNLFRSLLTNLDSFPSSSNPPLNGHSTVYPSTIATPEVQRQALDIWENHSMNATKAIAARSLRPPTPQLQEDGVDLDAHTPHPNTLIPALGRLDIETNTFLPIVPIDNQARLTPGVQQREVYGGPGHDRYPDVVVGQGGGGYGNREVGQNGKRQRTYDSAGSTPSSSNFESLQPWERDPWHIWQAKDENGSRTVAWSRKEQVQESLADKALGIELSRHLITVYFQAVHFSLPVLSPESFYIEWESCGRRADRMSPASEALCAVLEAWASRYSDNPAILGLPYQQAHTAPKVITSAGQFTPGSKGRAHWGKARLPVCNALLDRAGRVIDAASLLRRPSVTGLQALSLYNQLMHMSDQGSRVKDQWIQNMMVHSTIVEQMKLLQMFWTTGDPILTAEESNQDSLQLRMKQRRLFWTTAVADACWSAATGLPPKMPEEELQAGRAWVDEVMDNLPNSTIKMLAFFMKVWHRLSMVGRRISLEITKYNNKKGDIPVATFCTSIQQCWGEIRSIVTELNESAVRLMGACEPGILGFSPLNYITNMRLSCPFFLLVLHEAIRNHLAFRQSFYRSYVVDPDAEGQASQGEEDLGMLNKIHLQSIDVLLYNCRSQMEMFKDLLPTGIIQSASIMIRVLIASGQFMAEVPTNEQGYPASTLGGYDWTWEEKQRCISICTDALYQIGWAWSDVTEVLEAIHLSMERMTPSPDVLATYAFAREPINVKVQIQRSREMKIEHDGLQSALRFWPPKSIPAIIATSMNGGLDDVLHIPRGEAGSDLGQHMQLRLQGGNQNREGEEGVTFHTQFRDPSNPISAFFETINTSAMDVGTRDRHDRVDQFLTDNIPAFNALAQDPGSTSTFTTTSTSGPSTSSSDQLNMGFEYTSVNGISATSLSSLDWTTSTAIEPDTGQNGSGDQSFWELINGGREEDLDFSAFLQNFTEDNPAT